MSSMLRSRPDNRSAFTKTLVRVINPYITLTRDEPLPIDQAELKLLTYLSGRSPFSLEHPFLVELRGRGFARPANANVHIADPYRDRVEHPVCPLFIASDEFGACSALAVVLHRRSILPHQSIDVARLGARPPALDLL